MSDFHAGFFISRTDPLVHPAAFESIKRYLHDHDLPSSSHAIAWVRREGLPFYLLIVTLDGLFAGREVEAWVMNNESKLGPILAADLECDVWSYTYNNQVGYDSTTLWSRDQTVSSEHHTSNWDEGPSALHSLAQRLHVPVDLLTFDLVYGTPSVSARFDDHCDTELLKAYEKELLPMTDLNAAGTPQVLYVTAAMLSEMTSLAKAREYSLSDLIFDAWELGKHQLSTREEADHPVTLEKRPLKRAANENGVAPDLDRTSEKVGHTFHFDSTTLSELSEVATALDRSLSWVLQNAYLIARPALQRSKS